MARLPPHHVRRPRLTGLCTNNTVVVVEAASGYGKTVLALELADELRAIAVEVVLEEGPVPAGIFASRLNAAARRAGFSAAAEAMEGYREDPVGAVDAALDALAPEDCLIIVDDAHNAAPDAASLIARAAERLSGKAHLLVLARQLPLGAERLRRADALWLQATDLAMNQAEVMTVCNAGFGLGIGAKEASALEQATAGWTAATVLAAARARRTGEQVHELARAASQFERKAGAVALILDEALAALEPHKDLVAQIGRLPMLDRDIVDRMAGSPR